MIKLVSVILLLSLLTSCMGDSTMFVTGRIVDVKRNPVHDCQLSLYMQDRQKVISTVQTGSTFREDFVVSPRDREYFITVNCASNISAETRKFEYPLSDHSKNVVDLGEIVVTDTAAK